MKNQSSTSLLLPLKTFQLLACKILHRSTILTEYVQVSVHQELDEWPYSKWAFAQLAFGPTAFPQQCSRTVAIGREHVRKYRRGKIFTLPDVSFDHTTILTQNRFPAYLTRAKCKFVR